MNINKNGTATQIFTSTITRVIVLGGSFILSILLARYLGPENKGIVTAIFIVPNLLISIADLGIKQASAYYVGKRIYPSADVLGVVTLLWLISSMISVLIAYFYYSFSGSKEYGWSILILPLLSIPFMLLEKYMDGFLLGLQKVSTINLKQIISFLINFLITVFFILVFELNVFTAAITLLLVTITTSLYSLFKVKEKIRISIKYNKEIQINILKKGFLYAISLFILSLNYKVDILFLEKMSTPSELGLYSISVTLSELIWQIPTAIGMVIFSKSASTKDDKSSINRTIKLLRIVTIPSIVCSLILWLGSPILIPTLYGQIYENSSEMMRLLLPGILAMVIFKILNADLAGRGHVLFALNSYVIALVINVILNFILIPLYGGNGAALASSVSYSVGSIIICRAYSKKFSVSLKDMFILKGKDIYELKKIFKR